MVIIDASPDNQTEDLIATPFPNLQTQFVYRRAKQIGAAVQRNEAMAYASNYHVLFFDDDIVFEPDCLARLWQALQSDQRLGGVNATITNQRYLPPGKLSASLFRVLNGRPEESYAGRCIGPALNLLPEDRAELPEVVAVEWLNTGCTLYRREALPNPPFSHHFVGYSFMEDVALSLTVGKNWKLANARTARIYHDSQAAQYKSDRYLMAKMALVNRHFVMTRILKRTSASFYVKLAILEAFGIATSLNSTKAWRSLPSVLMGKASAIGVIVTNRQQPINEPAVVENDQRLASN
jgi:GT2 family glycosyltransferase